MAAVVGTYQNEVVKLDKEYLSDVPVKVIVTFLEDVLPQPEEVFALSDFSFLKSQKNLAAYKGSFSEAIIEERRLEQ